MNHIEFLFRQGLSDYPVLYKRDNATFIGRIIFEKEKIVFKDLGIINQHKDMELDEFRKYILGMVCFKRLHEWQSLSFYGVDYCRLIGEIDPDFKKSLMVTSGLDRVYDFIGSIYRAFQLLIKNGHIPIVLLKSIKSTDDTRGLTIVDLKSILDEDDEEVRHTIEAVDELLMNAIEKRLTIDLNDLEAEIS